MMDSPDILRRLDRQQIIGLEIGLLAKIILEASIPAEQNEEKFSAELDQLIHEIFQDADSLPFHEALRRAIALRANLNSPTPN